MPIATQKNHLWLRHYYKSFMFVIVVAVQQFASIFNNFIQTCKYTRSCSELISQRGSQSELLYCKCRSFWTLLSLLGVSLLYEYCTVKNFNEWVPSPARNSVISLVKLFLDRNISGISGFPEIFRFWLREKPPKAKDSLASTASKIPIIPRPQSQFPHSCVCERFIYSQDRSTTPQKKRVHIFSCGRIDRLILEIYKSGTETYECRNWETELYTVILFWK